jgi:hypothetical protein
MKRRFLGFATVALLTSSPVMAGSDASHGNANAADRGSGKARNPDIAAPRSSADIASVATAYETTTALTVSDDVASTFLTRGSDSVPFVFAKRVEFYQSQFSEDVPLNQAITYTMMAVDTPGNMGKETFSITAPPTAFKFGT